MRCRHEVARSATGMSVGEWLPFSFPLPVRPALRFGVPRYVHGARANAATCLTLVVHALRFKGTANDLYGKIGGLTVGWEASELPQRHFSNNPPLM